jgi:hypothetical protein
MIKILKFFNLLDYENNLSLTNILFYVSIVLFVMYPQTQTVYGLLLALLNYGHRRQVNDNRHGIDNQQTIVERGLKAEIMLLNNKVTQHETDIKSIIQANNNSLESVQTLVNDVNTKLKNFSSAMAIQEMTNGKQV